jgi:hypothetical protein
MDEEPTTARHRDGTVVHVTPSGATIIPPAHATVHRLEPPPLKVPCAHGTHAPPPKPALNVPLAHSAQPPAAAVVVPGGQGLHALPGGGISFVQSPSTASLVALHGVTTYLTPNTATEHGWHTRFAVSVHARAV